MKWYQFKQIQIFVLSILQDDGCKDDYTLWKYIQGDEVLNDNHKKTIMDLICNVLGELFLGYLLYTTNNYGISDISFTKRKLDLLDMDYKI